MKHIFRISVAAVNTTSAPTGNTRVDCSRTGLIMVRSATLLLFLFAFSETASAQTDNNRKYCPQGFTLGIDGVCRQVCPQGFSDAGLTCAKPKPYGRGGGHVGTSIFGGKTAIQNCEEANRRSGDGGSPAGQKCEMAGLLAYPKCKTGFYAVTVNICTPICPPGFADIGAFCSKPTRQAETYTPPRTEVLNVPTTDPRPPVPNPEPVPPRPAEPPPPDLTGWTICAPEGGQCPFNGTAEVRYGVGNRWVIGTFRNGVTCNNDVFGDPVPGVVKQCLLSPVIVPDAPPPVVVPDAPPDVNVRDANGNNDLHHAVSRNDLAAVNDLLNRGIDVNALNNSGETPVTFAVEFDNTPALLAMLAKGGDLNAALHRMASRNKEAMLRTVAGNYPIRMTNEMFDMAISSGGIGIALFSLNYGVDPNRAMGHGIYSRNMQMIDAALAAGANPDTAMIFAIENRMPNLISTALVRYNANAQTALELAIPINDMQTVALALDRGANPTKGLALAVKADNVPMVEALLARGAAAYVGLLPAIESGNTRMTDFLLKKGAEPSPASLVAAGGVGKIEIIDLLLAAGAHANIMLSGAIGAKNYDVTKYLLDHGGDAAAENFIEVAARNGDVRIAGLLIERGANPNKGLWPAVQEFNTAVVNLLVQGKADVSDPKLISFAAQYLRADIVAILLRAGADPQNGMKRAAGAHSPEIVNMLIDKGAKSKEPEYILEACTIGSAALAEALFRGGAPKG